MNGGNEDKAGLLDLFAKLAENGHAPEDGCELFGVGYEDAFSRLSQVYIKGRFARGGSAEKFVIGPYGSGKSHFLRHFMALCRSWGCATVDVQLNKKLDYTKSLIVYRELARRIQAPASSSRGMQRFLEDTLEAIRQRVPDGAKSTDFLRAWIDGLDKEDYELPQFGRVVQKAMDALLSGEHPIFDVTSRWLAGEIDNRQLLRQMPKELALPAVQSSEQEIYASDLMRSLFQFVRRAGYAGTVVGYDEAEQGFSVSRARRKEILSMLQSDINAIAGLKGGAVLLMFALTPDVAEHFDEFAALQQRLNDPGPGMGFFDGNTLAPRIDLTRRQDAKKELMAIGNRLATLFFEHHGADAQRPQADLAADIAKMADEIVAVEAESSNRRTMVKRTCTLLLSSAPTLSGLVANRGAEAEEPEA